MCGILYSALGKYTAKPTLEGRTNCVKALKRVAKRCAEFLSTPKQTVSACAMVARHILSQFSCCCGETERRTKAWCWVSR